MIKKRISSELSHQDCEQSIVLRHTEEPELIHKSALLYEADNPPPDRMVVAPISGDISSGETSIVEVSKSVSAIREESTSISSADALPLSVDLSVDVPVQDLNIIPKGIMKPSCSLGENFVMVSKSELQVLVEELNDAVFNYLLSEPRAAKTLGLVMCSNHTEEKKAWEMGISSCSAENLVGRELIGCYKEEPPPSLTNSGPQTSIRAKRRKPASSRVDTSSGIVTAKELHLRYKRSILKRWTTAHNDQRSNRGRKKAGSPPSCELLNFVSSSSPSPNERRSVPGNPQMGRCRIHFFPALTVYVCNIVLYEKVCT